MSSKTLMSVEEYLETSFEDGDCDYLDGEVEERNLGEGLHSAVQAQLIILLAQSGSQFGIMIRPEIRVKIRDRRYRVADIGVWRKGPFEARVPSTPPWLVIEILSPEDRIARVLPRIRDYLTVGVECVWLIDPYERTAFLFTAADPGGEQTNLLQTQDPAIRLSLEEILPKEAYPSA